jgi:hypothetical protein
MADMDNAEFNYSSEEDEREEQETEDKEEREPKAYQSYEEIASSKDFEKMMLSNSSAYNTLRLWPLLINIYPIPVLKAGFNGNKYK